MSGAVLTEEESPGAEPVCGTDPAFTSVTVRGENQWDIQEDWPG